MSVWEQAGDAIDLTPYLPAGIDDLNTRLLAVERRVDRLWFNAHGPTGPEDR